MKRNTLFGDTQLFVCPHGQTHLSPRQFLAHIECIMKEDRHVEKIVAVGSFLAAVALAFTSLLISHDHDIAAGVLMMCAQFLTLTAAIFGLDYKFTDYMKRLKDDR